MYVCISGGKKCSFFGKFGVFCFLETPVLRFALLPYYRRVMLSTYRYTGIFCCFTAVCNNDYTIAFIIFCKIVHVASLQGSYFMVSCSCHFLKTYVLIMNDFYLVISFLNTLLRYLRFLCYNHVVKLC